MNLLYCFIAGLLAVVGFISTAFGSGWLVAACFNKLVEKKPFRADFNQAMNGLCGLFLTLFLGLLLTWFGCAILGKG